MSTPLRSAAPSTHIDRDVGCVRCGYNLRGLNQNSLCPECASPIAESLKAQWIGNADRKWLTRIVIGAMLLSGAFLSRTLAAGLIALGAGPGFLLAWVTIFSIVAVLQPIGVWMITRIERGDSLIEPRLSAWMMRIFAILAALGYGVWSIAVVALLLHGSGRQPPALSILRALKLASYLWWIAVPLNFLLLRYFANLAARIPSPVLARQAWSVAWVMPGSEAMLYLALWVPVLRSVSPEKLITTLQWTCGISLGWATVVVFSTARLLFRVYRHADYDQRASLDSEPVRRTIRAP